MGFLSKVPDRLLTLTAAAGSLMIVLVVSSLLVGIRPVFLTSGSMAPAMPTGSLTLTRQVGAADLAVGDVVCVLTTTGARVTHRIVAIDPAGPDLVDLTLQGDANTAPDQETYRVADADRVIADVPLLGYLFGWFNTPFGYLLAGAVGFGLLMLVVRGENSAPRGRPAPAGRPGDRGRHRSRRVRLGPTTALMVLGTGSISPVSAAPWTDPVTLGGSTMTAAVVPAPATFTCGTLGLLSVRFNWTAVAGASDYTLHYGNGGGSTTTVTGTTALLTSAISGGTAWVVANRDVGSTTWSSVASNSRSYTVAVVSLCA